MSKTTTLLTSIVCLAAAAMPVAQAAEHDAMACTVTVDYSLNNVARLSYTKDFVVSEAAPFSDDFSTATRFRFFDAYMTVESGTPVVTILFDADVSVFNTVDFSAMLKVHDEAHGETTSGSNAFFSSSTGANRTNYTLACKRNKD